MRCTDAQVRKLMEEYGKHGKVGLAGVRAGMSRKTAAKYLALGELPSIMGKIIGQLGRLLTAFPAQ